MKTGRNIRIYNVPSNTLVYIIDTRTSPDVFFLNTTLQFYVRNPPWTLGASYYVAFDQGVITANNTCATESSGFGGK